MDGFETCRDDSDFRARGYIVGPTKVQAGFVPSITTVAGTSLKKIGPTPASPNTQIGVAGAADLAYLNLGFTVNQAWLAGGFSLGVSARQNSGVANSYGDDGQWLNGYRDQSGYSAAIIGAVE